MDSQQVPFQQPQLKQEAIWQVVAAIPVGTVASYGQVAQLAGLGRAARYVGSCMKKLPEDTQLPWHRVLRSDGRLAFTNTSPHFQQQQQRLDKEGVTVKNGRVSMKIFQWIP